MEEKVYCEKCKKFFYPYPSEPTIQRCKIVVDDYFNESHEVEFTPSIKNCNNDCLFFVPIEIKKEDK